MTTHPSINSPPRPDEGSSALAKAKAGDEEAFCELVKPLEERLFRQACVLTGDPSLAKELAQETLVAAWKSIHRFDGACQLFTWLYAIQIRLNRKRLRTLHRKPLVFWGLFQWDRHHPEASTENRDTHTNTPASRAVESEEHRELRTLIETLSSKHREIILLRFYASASLDEIAHLTDSSLGTVKSRLHYALEKLRQKRNSLSHEPS